MKQTSRISQSDVKRISSLAKISLKKSEEPTLERDLSSILSYVEMIGKLETSDKSNISSTGRASAFRQDTTTPSLSAKDATSGSVTAQDGYFVIPTVINKQ